MSASTAPPRLIPQWHQQVFALDAKYNSRRTGQTPLGLLYIRRRSQLLREKDSKNSGVRTTYVKLRSDLLKRRYGAVSEYNGLGSRASIDGVQIEDKFPKAKLNKKSTAESFAFAGVHHVFDQHIAGVTALKFANNDKSKLCCASFDGTISICNVTDMPPRVVFKLEGHKKGVTGIDWSISNDSIVSSSLDATVRLWGVHGDDNPVCLRVVADQFRAEVLCCAFVPWNNNLVITGNAQGLLQVIRMLS